MKVNERTHMSRRISQYCILHCNRILVIHVSNGQFGIKGKKLKRQSLFVYAIGIKGKMQAETTVTICLYNIDIKGKMQAEATVTICI